MEQQSWLYENVTVQLDTSNSVTFCIAMSILANIKVQNSDRSLAALAKTSYYSALQGQNSADSLV